MYLRALEIYLLNYKNLVLQFFLDPRLAWQAALEKTKVKSDDIILMAEKRIRGGTCHSVYQYEKANSK